MGDRLLTTAEVAEKLHISVAHAYKLLKDGKIPTVRFGKLVRVRKEDLDKYIFEKTGPGIKLESPATHVAEAADPTGTLRTGGSRSPQPGGRMLHVRVNRPGLVSKYDTEEEKTVP